MNSKTESNPWMHRFAVFTALATLFLIWMGGLVTSKGVGMSVPDWPTTFGYNMFLFPISKWGGGIFYEHSHRLIASAVGFLTVILAVWLWLKEERKWLRNLGLISVLAVILQGVLGGLRVTWIADELGIFHATLAQLFFLLICSIALFTSGWWSSLGAARLRVADRFGLRAIFISTTLLILVQLVLGATMRHQHAGLAIPDFPKAHGQWWPATDEASVSFYNRSRHEVLAVNPITALQIHLQMAHRIIAAGILVLVGLAFYRARRQFGLASPLGKLTAVWLGLICLQALLGAATIWSNKAADVATAHVLVGAVSFATGFCGCLLSLRLLSKRRVAVPVAAVSGQEMNVPA